MRLERRKLLRNAVPKETSLLSRCAELAFFGNFLLFLQLHARISAQKSTAQVNDVSPQNV